MPNGGLVSPETEVLARRICTRLRWIVGDDASHFSSSILSIMTDLGLRDERSTRAAIRWAVDNGWLIAEGNPPHSIRFPAHGQRHF